MRRGFEGDVATERPAEHSRAAAAADKKIVRLGPLVLTLLPRYGPASEAAKGMMHSITQ